MMKRTVSLSENEIDSDDLEMPMPLNMRSPPSRNSDHGADDKYENQMEN